MEAERVVEMIHEMEWNVADHDPDVFDRHGANVFGLCLGVDGETGLVGRKERLERMDEAEVRRNRDDRHHSPP